MPEKMTPLGLIEIPMPKGCILVLTAAEYARGVARGKAKKRRLALEKRLAARQTDPQRVPHRGERQTGDTGR